MSLVHRLRPYVPSEPILVEEIESWLRKGAEGGRAR